MRERISNKKDKDGRKDDQLINEEEKDERQDYQLRGEGWEKR